MSNIIDEPDERVLVALVALHALLASRPNGSVSYTSSVGEAFLIADLFLSRAK
jgi:hypothetical protein